MPRYLLPLLAVIAVAGCATSGRPGRAAASDAGPPGKPVIASAPRQPNLPAQPLTRDIMFKLLVGEVAGQRGEIGLAAEAYAELAKSTRDPRVAKRATEAAMYAQNPELAIRSSRIWMESDPGDEAAAQTHASVLINDPATSRLPNPVMAGVLRNRAGGSAEPCCRSVRC
jgi:hypothetical protein